MDAIKKTQNVIQRNVIFAQILFHVGRQKVFLLVFPDVLCALTS